MKRKTLIPFGGSADYSIDFLLGVIEDARVTTLERVEGISKEMLHWQYAEGWNTIGALLSHIISCRKCFRILFIEGREFTKEEDAELTPAQEMGKYIPQLITDDEIDVYIERLHVSNIELVQAVSEISKEAFLEKREGYNPETGCNLAWILYHLAEDEVHHRGQISLIQKLYKANNPSADS